MQTNDSQMATNHLGVCISECNYRGIGIDKFNI